MPKQVRETVRQLIGIDEGSSDHIMSIEKLLETISTLNKEDYLIKNKGRIRLSEEPCGNWDKGSVLIEILRDETEEERQERELAEASDKAWRYEMYLRLKEEFEPHKGE